MQNKNFKTQTINIDQIYNQLQHHLAKRAKYQDRQNELWKEIKRTNANKTAQMKATDKAIGYETHEINQLICQLCQYKKTHKAMNLASSFINSEINRINKIVVKWRRDIQDVEARRSSFIMSTGQRTYDTTFAKQYLAKKEATFKKLISWKRHVDQYRV